MRVFVTGASGHIGSALVPELLSAGHQVVGLARSDAAAAGLVAVGAGVHRGDLGDLAGLRDAASGADGVVHLAFRHDAMQAGDFAGAIETDQRAVEAIGDALAGSGKPFVIASGTLLLAFAGLGRTGTEADVVPGGPRIDTENALIALAERDVRSSAVRLPPTVHSTLDLHGFVPALIGFARQHGTAAYLGDGANRWPAVHTLDAARLLRLALESAPPGSRLHAVADQGVPFRQIAQTIGRHLDLPAGSVTPQRAEQYLGYLAGFAGLDNPTSSAHTQQLLDWHPTGPGLLVDLDSGHYFQAER
jgi:nucleoside-diphosphate-sugar epimerase